MRQFYSKPFWLNKNFFVVCLILLCFGRKVGIRLWTPLRAVLIPGGKCMILMGGYLRNKGGNIEMGRRKKQIMVYDGNWSSIILRNSRRQWSTCPQYSQLRKGTAVGIDFKFNLRTVGYLYSNHGLVGTFWLAGWLCSSQGDIINAFPPSASEAAPAGMMKTSQPRTGFEVNSNLVSLCILPPWCVVF